MMKLTDDEIHAKVMKEMMKVWKESLTPGEPPLCPGGDISPEKYYRLSVGLDEEDDSGEE